MHARARECPDARAIRVDAFVRAFVSFRVESCRVLLDGDDDVDDDDGDAIG